ncbi:50S ribosomal protein L2 [Candidatus Uhrbacteria bacterium]|nr:50S ribosomal protein L2 [Candidatus Uhrbacteria bacterium]
MALRLFKPTTPGRRHASVSDFSGLTKKRPQKNLIEIRKKHSGRNNQGKITVRHRGGGVKRYYRIIDFFRKKFDIPATVSALEYDPNRSARIALLQYADGEKSYIIAPNGLQVGENVVSSQSRVEVKVGNRGTFTHIPVGTLVHSIELFPGQGGKLVRSAGGAGRLMSVEGDIALIKLPSGEVRSFSKQCMATIGDVGNTDHQHVRYGKAGRRRLLGWKPTVRGKAMNPVDHPHGGGEGNQPVGLKHPKTPQGKPALGVRTRNKKKWSNRFIVTRRT